MYVRAGVLAADDDVHFSQISVWKDGSKSLPTHRPMQRAVRAFTPTAEV